MPPSVARLAGAAMNCLEDETVHDFVRGELAAIALDEVDAHLDSCVACRALVAELATSAGGAQVQPGDPFTLARGASVGRYLLLERIGEGAMGVVFAAYDPELNRRVALKLLREVDSASGQERLLREAQAMARLADPNVVTLYEAGRHGDSVFLAMELVPGKTLREWLAEDERDLHTLLTIFREAGNGLAAAHRAQLVHRDFKPDNVLVGEDGRVRVTDFGLARGDKRVSSGDALLNLSHIPILDEQPMTRTGTLLGTPAYMAPEQLRGQPASASSDQYSFCVALYEALFGVRPFTGKTAADLLDSTEHTELVFVRNKQVPKWLEDLLAKGLRVSPEERHASMDVLVAALQSRPTRDRRPLALAVAGIVIALAAITVFAARDSSQPVVAAMCESAERDFDRLWTPERQAALKLGLEARPGSSQAENAVLARLSSYRQEWIAESTSTCRSTRVDGNQSEALLDVRMQCLQRGLFAFDALTLELASRRGGASLQLADLEDALPQLAACRDTESLVAVAAPRLDEREVVRVLESETARVRALVAVAEYEEARRVASDAFAKARTLDYAPLKAQLALVLAEAQRHLGALDSAADSVQSSIVEAMAAKSPRDLAQAWIEAVAIAGESGNLKLALQDAQYANAILEDLEQDDELVARLANNWGTVYYRMARYPEARAQLQRSLSLRKLLFGDKSSLVARSLTNLGNLERVSDNLDQALAYHQQALDIDTAMLGGEHPDIARHLHNIAGVMRRQGKREAAVAVYQKALDLRIALLGNKHQDVALTLNSLGLIHQELGEPVLARQFYLRSLEAYPEPGHPDRALSLHGLGLLEMEAGELEPAQAHLREALALFENRLDDADERVSRILLALSASALARGKREEALGYATRARAGGNVRFASDIDNAVAAASASGSASLDAKTKSDDKRAAVVNTTVSAEAAASTPAEPEATGQMTGTYSSSPAWD